MKLLNFIRKLLADYTEFEKQLTQIHCLVVDNGQSIKKVIKIFPRKQRKQVIKHAYYLARWGCSLDYIVNTLIEIRNMGGEIAFD